MKLKSLIFITVIAGTAAILPSCGDEWTDNVEQTPDHVEITVSKQQINASYQPTATSITVDCVNKWGVISDQAWIRAAKNLDGKTVNINLLANRSDELRTADLLVVSGIDTVKVAVSQEPYSEDLSTGKSFVPEGYSLVWSDEFDYEGEPLEEWVYETGNSGFGNDELQTAVPIYASDGTQLATVKNGSLTLSCAQIGDEVCSIRMNTQTYWKYGYFEGRFKLPKGKGIWPAFWMIPEDESTWPLCGEIDIMESVGFNPNVAYATIHTEAGNHMSGTETQAECYVPRGIEDFHTYAIEWTEDYIKSYIDGNLMLIYENDHAGNQSTWPFYNPFRIRLNLAWGGRWGGQQGLDPTALPCDWEIDYIRVYQKEQSVVTPSENKSVLWTGDYTISNYTADARVNSADVNVGDVLRYHLSSDGATESGAMAFIKNSSDIVMGSCMFKPSVIVDGCIEVGVTSQMKTDEVTGDYFVTGDGSMKLTKVERIEAAFNPQNVLFYGNTGAKNSFFVTIPASANKIILVFSENPGHIQLCDKNWKPLIESQEENNVESYADGQVTVELPLKEDIINKINADKEFILNPSNNVACRTISFS